MTAIEEQALVLGACAPPLTTPALSLPWLTGMAEDTPDDSGSTLVRSGKTATTFTEMATFVHDLEARPPARLLEDLPGLMALPEGRYALVVMVLRKKTRPNGAERGPILTRLGELQSSSDDPVVRARCTLFLERPE